MRLCVNNNGKLMKKELHSRSEEVEILNGIETTENNKNNFRPVRDPIPRRQPSVSRTSAAASSGRQETSCILACVFWMWR